MFGLQFYGMMFFFQASIDDVLPSADALVQHDAEMAAPGDLQL
jgi:hypothetical protein